MKTRRALPVERVGRDDSVVIVGQDSSRDTSIGSEHAGGHGDDAVETILLNKFFADVNVSVGGAKQYPVGNDDGGTTAILKQA